MICEKAFLINLEKRRDRLEHAKRECKKVGIAFERIEAIDANLLTMDASQFQDSIHLKNRYTKGCFALGLTLLNILKRAKQDGLESIMILEDDVKFSPNAHEIMKLAMAQLPYNWQLINFGCYHFNLPLPFSTNLVQITGGWHSHCFAIRNTCYDIAIDKLSETRRPCDLDLFWQLPEAGILAFATNPNIAFQASFKSDIFDDNGLNNALLPSIPFECKPIVPIEKYLRKMANKIFY